MADIASDVAFRISQTGAETVRQSLEGVNQALDRSSKSTSRLTGFVKEQRRENLQQNFLFNQSRGAITSSTFALMSLTSATGGSSKAVQQLNTSLNQGFNAFQGTNFAMAGLGMATGGAALAITGLVAGGIALFSFLDTSKEKAKAAAEQMSAFASAAKDMAAGIGGEQAGREVQKIDLILGAAEKRLKALEASLGLMGGKAPRFAVEALAEMGIGPGADLAAAIKQESNYITILKLRRAALVDVVAAEEQLGLVEKRKRALKEPEMGEPPLPWGWARQTGREIDKEIKEREREIIRAIDKSFKKTKKEVGDIDAELRKLQHDQMKFLALLDRGLGTLRTALTALGVQMDSYIGKLLSALEIATAIAEIIQTISTLASFFSLFFGGVSIPMGAITTPGPIKPLPKMAGGGETTNITINAIDARSFQQMLAHPDNRRVFVSALSNAERLGIS